MIKNEQLEKLINNTNYTFYAHKANIENDYLNLNLNNIKESSSEKELLFDHLKLTYEYYMKLEKQKGLKQIVKNLIKGIFKVDDNIVDIGYDLFESAIYYHDIGKINPLFQKDKMGNDLNIETEYKQNKHSILSARIFLDTFFNICKEYKSPELVCLLIMFSYIISRHHSQLENIYDFSEELKGVEVQNLYKHTLSDELVDKIITGSLKEYLKNSFLDEIGLYILNKLLYSCIIISDYYATYEYMNKEKVQFIEKNEHLFDKYENSSLYKTITNYKEGKVDLNGINKTRSDLFIEVSENVKDNIKENLFYIEAPTGSGKTNIAINVTRELYLNNKDIQCINYIFPFNTIVDQTENKFEEYFTKFKDFITINSISEMSSDSEENVDYESAYMKNVFRDYPLIITSHVNMFSSLFGIGKEINYSLLNYVNSVVVLDEIQAYPNKKWREMIEMFSKYAKYLNIKFVIMSATLPRIDTLLDNENKVHFISLVGDVKKYYLNPIFKDRVSIDYSLLNKKIDLNELADKILKNDNKKILVECIKKKTANELYEILKSKENEVYIITGDDNSYQRMKIIDLINKSENRKLILVSTQTIEAGVDIDMDIGYKDISFLDNEEQFLGRINRSCKKSNSIAYFFNLDSAANIYKEDRRVGYDLRDDNVKQFLVDKNFSEFYKLVLKKVKDKSEEFNENNIENLYKACRKIDFSKVNKIMTLLKDNTISILLNYNIQLENCLISGKSIWEQYKEILKNNEISYVEKKVRLANLSRKMSLFTYSIYLDKINMIHGEKFGGYYYIEDGEKYIKNGRFNSEMFFYEGDSLFL